MSNGYLDYIQVKNNNWSVLTDQQLSDIMTRLDKLYQDMPLEYAGVVLSAIQDIEDIIYKK
jgi:hypothetical protein